MRSNCIDVPFFIVLYILSIVGGMGRRVVENPSRRVTPKKPSQAIAFTLSLLSKRAWRYSD